MSEADRPTALIHVPSRSEQPGRSQRGGWLCFRRPLDVLVAASAAEVPELLRELRLAVRDGAWAAGYFGYEATPAFDSAFAAHDPRPGEPVAWWALFGEPVRLDALPAVSMEQLESAEIDDSDLDWQPLVTRQEHADAVEEVRHLISEGETYQVNLTFPLEARLAPELDPYRHFVRWVHERPPYSAWIDPGAAGAADIERTGPATVSSAPIVASASPELFFRLEGDRLTARPMKGTSRRGRWLEEDEARRAELLSEKNRAENLMITDMLRNDLGRVAVPGSVRVTRLFSVETYATVHQLISEVTANLEPGRDALDVVRALYPCASITGAPKARTSHIIRRLEPHPRGIYTGSAGYFAPDGSAQLNVLIRTASFDRRSGAARYGTGGGVVWDSLAADEYREAGTKTRLLRRSRPLDGDFRLLETMLWRQRSGFFLLAHHLRRLTDSARYLGFDVDREAVEAELMRRAAGWSERTRVRLLAARDGSFEIQSVAEPCPGRQPLRVVVDDRPVDDRDVLLFHKTTHRGVYERALARHPAVDDVLLWNERGELTESTRANLIVEIGGRRLTPPRACGLLAGTYRQALLERGSIEEKVLRRDDLARADRLLLVNSVRGFQRFDLSGVESVPGL